MAGTQNVRPVKVPGSRKSQIAVLDANPAILDYIHRILAKHFDVSLYTEAPEFCRSLKESPKPDLLLVDFNIADDKVDEDPPAYSRMFMLPTHLFPSLCWLVQLREN